MILKPIKMKESYVVKIRSLIDAQLLRTVYMPLARIVDEQLRDNAKHTPLEAALINGDITYKNGYLYGKFSAAIGKEIRKHGGVFDRRTKAYKLDMSKLPITAKTAIAHNAEAMRQQKEAINKSLDNVQEIQLDIDTALDEIFDDLALQADEIIPEDLEVPMSLDGYNEDILRKAYHENMDLYVKEWQDEAVQRMRNKVDETVRAGYRADTMSDILQSEYGISKRKADFLARQETSLLVSKYHREKAQAIGSKEYIWSTSADMRVRDRHKDLNGRTFSWDSPPIVDSATGRTGHPGEDFQCRCVARPILAGV